MDNTDENVVYRRAVLWGFAIEVVAFVLWVLLSPPVSAKETKPEPPKVYTSEFITQGMHRCVAAFVVGPDGTPATMSLTCEWGPCPAWTGHAQEDVPRVSG